MRLSSMARREDVQSDKAEQATFHALMYEFILLRIVVYNLEFKNSFLTVSGADIEYSIRLSELVVHCITVVNFHWWSLHLCAFYDSD